MPGYRCPNCRARVSRDYERCAECGQPLAWDQVPPPPTVIEPPVGSAGTITPQPATQQLAEQPGQTGFPTEGPSTPTPPASPPGTPPEPARGVGGAPTSAMDVPGQAAEPVPRRRGIGAIGGIMLVLLLGVIAWFGLSFGAAGTLSSFGIPTTGDIVGVGPKSQAEPALTAGRASGADAETSGTEETPDAGAEEADTDEANPSGEGQ